MGNAPRIWDGQVLVPAPHPAQFRGGAAAKKRREHQAKDFAQQFLLASQAAFDLLDEVVGQAQGMQGLFEGLNGPLRLALIRSQPLLALCGDGAVWLWRDAFDRLWG